MKGKKPRNLGMCSRSVVGRLAELGQARRCVVGSPHRLVSGLGYLDQETFLKRHFLFFVKYDEHLIGTASTCWWPTS